MPSTEGRARPTINGANGYNITVIDSLSRSLAVDTLADKRIVLGVTGGIAAYKGAELVRRLREHGTQVRVVMTAAAAGFVGPLTFQALSGHAVHTQLLDPEAESAMGHIELARWGDIVLIAPASANFIAKLTHGLGDDLLTTLCLAASAPLVVAPAMNRQMWRAAATQANVATLRDRGVSILGPGSGDQACGEVGPGRMLEVTEIIEGLRRVLKTGELSGKSILVTAGPTRENIDPVRYISNRSSGKMGYALGRSAAEAGGIVTLISGPVTLTPPDGVRHVPVTTAQQMFEAVMENVGDADIFVGAAAVADYRCAAPKSQKIKKTGQDLALSLTRTPDILATVAGLKPRPFVVGFAAETENLEKNARLKLKAKSLDMVAANLVNSQGTGFDSDNNALHVFWPSGDKMLPQASKQQLSRELISIITSLYREKHPT